VTATVTPDDVTCLEAAARQRSLVRCNAPVAMTTTSIIGVPRWVAGYGGSTYPHRHLQLFLNMFDAYLICKKGEI